MAHRKYELKARAEKQDETRRRIAQAALDLHTTVGPAATTIKGIAERAGVERLTVYRHFPDADALFAACGGLWMETVETPDFETLLSEPDPVARVERTLEGVYAYYEANADALYPIFRDIDQVPALKSMMEAGWFAVVNRARDALVEAFDPRDASAAEVVRGLLGHALDFWAWRSFRSQQLGNERIVELMKGMVGLMGPVIPKAQPAALDR